MIYCINCKYLEFDPEKHYCGEDYGVGYCTKHKKHVDFYHKCADGEERNPGWRLYAKISSIIHLLAAKLYLPEKVANRAFILLDKVTKDDRIRVEIQGKKPSSIAASLVYIASKLEGEWLTQREILEALNWTITETTLRKNYHKICVLLGIPEVWIRNL